MQDEQNNEISRDGLATRLLGQTILSAELAGELGQTEGGYIVLETTGGIRLYADAPTAYQVDPPRPHPRIALIEARLAEVSAQYQAEVEPGVSDDSVLEAERDTLSWVLATLKGGQS